MEVVLYTDDMEPITVIDLPRGLCDMLDGGRMVHVAVQTPVNVAASVPPVFADTPPKQVSIWAERFRRKGRDHVFLFTRDEEVALLLKASFLPGQRREVQEEFKRGLAHGLSIAFGLL